MSARAGLRFFSQHARPLRSAPQPLRRPVNSGRRFQSTEAAPAEQQSLLQRLWNSPVGVKTVHFWAPVMKWGVVIAGISDFARPAEKLSLTQNLAITATGAIWTRWCLIIKPRNVLLAAVNFFLGCVGIIQVSRIFIYRQSQKKGSISDTVKEDVEDLGNSAVDAAKEVGDKAKALTN